MIALSSSGRRSGSTVSVHSGSTNGSVSLILRLEGLLALCCAGIAYAAVSADWPRFALLFLVPDISMLGYLAGKSIGAASYNLGHSYLSPGALALAGFAAHVPVVYPVALIWVAHIGFDRALGYGLKYPAGFGVTHLGAVGRGSRATASD